MNVIFELTVLNHVGFLVLLTVNGCVRYSHYRELGKGNTGTLCTILAISCQS